MALYYDTIIPQKKIYQQSLPSYAAGYKDVPLSAFVTINTERQVQRNLSILHEMGTTYVQLIYS